MNSDGKIIGQASGLGTNHHLLGMQECQDRIADIIEKAKESAGISSKVELHALVSNWNRQIYHKTYHKLLLIDIFATISIKNGTLTIGLRFVYT